MQDQPKAEVGTGTVPGAEISGVSCEPVLFIVRFPDPGEQPGLEEPEQVSVQDQGQCTGLHGTVCVNIKNRNTVYRTLGTCVL